jgi:hypothetical protein
LSAWRIIMKKIPNRELRFGIIIFIFALLLSVFTSCMLFEKPEFTVSGTAFDSVTGNALVGVTVIFGDETATTDAEGKFSFTYESADPVSGMLAIYKYGYRFQIMENVEIAVENNPKYQIAMTPDDTDTYTTKEISFTLTDAGTPLAEKTVAFIIVNERNGTYLQTGEWLFGTQQTDVSGEVTINTPAFGTDCMVAVQMMEDGVPNPVFSYWYHTGIDLSGTAPVTVSLEKPALTPVTIKGSTENLVIGHLFKEETEGTVVIPYYFMNILFTDGDDIINLYLPAESGDTYAYTYYNGLLGEKDSATGAETTRMQVTTPAAIAASNVITLPELPDTPSLQAVAGSSINYTASTRTISFTDPNTETNSYELLFQGKDSGSNRKRGILLLESESFVFPQDFIDTMITPAAADGYTFEVTVKARYLDPSDFSIMLNQYQPGMTGFAMVETEDTETLIDDETSQLTPVFQ